jgi:ubiquinone/menaquinone biosynthesis C-methylase UbiE
MKVDLPYFDIYLRELDRGNTAIENFVGRHVHWGFWDDPARADENDANDFAQAADRLTLQLLDHARPAPGDNILDAGCGFGGSMALMNESYDSLRMTGLNIDHRQLARAEKMVRARGSNTIHFVEGDACALPFVDASFDIVLAIECIFHFPSRLKFFQETHRVLKPGGRLVLTDFVARGAMVPVIAAIFPWFEKDHVRIHGKSNEHIATVGTYRTLERKASFRCLVSRDITCETMPTYAFIRRFGRALGKEAPSYLRAFRFVELITRLGAYRYRIMAYEKL